MNLNINLRRADTSMLIAIVEASFVASEVQEHKIQANVQLQFVSDVTKYISGCMASLSAMVQLEIPHVNVLTKVDLLPNKRDLEK
jgi:hypothetical protein